MNKMPIQPVRRLFDAKAVRELDRIAIEEEGIAGIVLMKRAGQAVFSEIRNRWSDRTRLFIFCGSGNNGGDGYIVAGLALQSGFSVHLFEISEPEKLSGDAKTARDFALNNGASPEPAMNFNGELDLESVIVDALLGTGFAGEPRDEFARLIDLINSRPMPDSKPEIQEAQYKTGRVPVVSADIPSGLEATTGKASSHAITADVTVCFIGQKLGMHTGNGPDCCGDLVFDHLGVPESIYSGVQPLAATMCVSEELASLPERLASNHKGSHGHVLVIGGSYGMGGAPLMTTTAALRMGAGLVSVATHPDHVSAFLSRQPELMVRGLKHPGDVDALIDKATVLAVGPGLGTSAWGQRLLQSALESGKPLVLDADALNLLASENFRVLKTSSTTVMTPHPGEAARMLGVTTTEIQSNRYLAVNQLAETFGGVQVLKGAGTLVCSQDELGVCPYGNPGMGTAGMGDILTGIISGLFAQGLSADQAARLGVCIHSRAADILVEQHGSRGLLATDLIPIARGLLNGV